MKREESYQRKKTCLNEPVESQSLAAVFKRNTIVSPSIWTVYVMVDIVNKYEKCNAIKNNDKNQWPNNNKSDDYYLPAFKKQNTRSLWRKTKNNKEKV